MVIREPLLEALTVCWGQGGGSLDREGWTGGRARGLTQGGPCSPSAWALPCTARTLLAHTCGQPDDTWCPTSRPLLLLRPSGVNTSRAGLSLEDRPWEEARARWVPFCSPGPPIQARSSCSRALNLPLSPQAAELDPPVTFPQRPSSLSCQEARH